jgi:hypothetical protein
MMNALIPAGIDRRSPVRDTAPIAPPRRYDDTIMRRLVKRESAVHPARLSPGTSFSSLIERAGRL